VSMDLILWRHAEAEPGADDLGRRLTTKGTKEAERMAQWLAPRLPESCRIVASPAERTRQTAGALGRRFEIANELAPGGTVAAVLAVARWRRAKESVVIVGHQPTLGAVAAFLLSGEEAYWSIRKGAIWWLSERERDSGAAVVLRVAIAPDLL
jgi:phosphohistidine phosphatase